MFASQHIYFHSQFFNSLTLKVQLHKLSVVLSDFFQSIFFDFFLLGNCDLAILFAQEQVKRVNICLCKAKDNCLVDGGLQIL